MKIKIIDTTLRDGEQQPGIALGIKEKVAIAKLIDLLGVEQIEAGVPAVGLIEQKCISKILELKLRSKISTWNRMNIKDLDCSIACGAEIIHISVPASDLQLTHKLRRTRNWVVEQMIRCITYVKEKNLIASVGFEDASRSELAFLHQLCQAAIRAGADKIRYADTVGILSPARTLAEMVELKKVVPVELGIHTHDDLGMAVANALTAVKGGANFVDCTVGGVGERAGNCNYTRFVAAAKAQLGVFSHLDLKKTGEIEAEIKYRFEQKHSMPFSV